MPDLRQYGGTPLLEVRTRDHQGSQTNELTDTPKRGPGRIEVRRSRPIGTNPSQIEPPKVTQNPVSL